MECIGIHCPWGIPIRKNQYKSKTMFAMLSWYHETMVPRRTNIPSWSFLGWEGAFKTRKDAEWTGDNGHSLAFEDQQNPRHLLDEGFTMLLDLFEDNRYLHYEGPVCQLFLTNVTSSESDLSFRTDITFGSRTQTIMISQPGTYAAVRITRHIIALLPLSLDSILDGLEVTCVLISWQYGPRGSQFSCIVLKASDGLYERIGSFDFDMRRDLDKCYEELLTTEGQRLHTVNWGRDAPFDGARGQYFIQEAPTRSIVIR
ncbi:hypothetical protein BKA67DRAFT_399151 [Truncatella angustata]|uniref:Uncharacterized protein n=1 Tax=Truncatella angustata TaxID=152316 RepID=A0A9P8UD78_9PEZI|nr:uncharacterized protein BKA67DRAFT_399151 [Truncatella angustata]KAH6647813.1 hypothetical protein BKA67DRAFT_399151 [Truncatella angustata]